MTQFTWKGVSADWTTAADWTPTGVPGATDSALITSAGTYTVTVGSSESITTGSLTLNAAAATFEIDGSFTAGTLTLQAGQLNVFGTLAKTTLVLTGGTVNAAQSGVLSGDTIRGALTLSDLSILQVANGITFQGAGGVGQGTLNLTQATTGAVLFNDNETLSNVAINAGSASGFDFIDGLAGLTLARNASLNAVGSSGFLVQVSDTFTNQGLITAGFAGGTASISAGGIVNSGIISVSNGSSLTLAGGQLTNTGTLLVDATSLLTLNLTGTNTAQTSGGLAIISGVLDAAGGTIDLGANAAFANTFLTGTIANATIATDGGTLNAFDGVLSGDVVRGTLVVGDTNILQIANGILLTGAAGTGPGTINVTGATTSALLFDDQETLFNTTVNVGSAEGFDFIDGLAGLTLAANTTLNAVGASGFQLQISDTLTNQGVINATASGSSSAIFAAGFVNSGQVNLGAGDQLDIEAAVSGSGAINAASRSALTLGDSVAATQAINLSGTGDLVTLLTPSTVLGSFNGFVSSDRIDLTAENILSETVSFANGTATVTGGGSNAALHFGGSFAGRGFGLVSDGNGGTFLIVGNTVAGSASGNANLQLGSQNAIVSLQGNRNTVTAQGGDVVVTGGSNATTVNAGQGNVVINLSGVQNTVSSGTGTAANGNDVVRGNFSVSKITLGNGNNIIATTGAGNTLILGDGDNVVQAGNGGTKLTLGNGSNQVSFTGPNETIVAGDGDNTISGTTASVSSVKVTLGNGNNTVTLSGTADVTSVGSGFNTIVAGSGSDTVTVAGGVSLITIRGAGDVVNLGASSSSVTDDGSGLKLVEGTNAGNSLVLNAASDPSLLADLTGGVGGYTTAQQAYAALQSDGHGGSILHLGNGSLDFVNELASQLSVKNFQIG